MELLVVGLGLFILITFVFISDYVSKTKVELDELHKKVEDEQVEKNMYKREYERVCYDKEIKSCGIDKMLIIKNINHKLKSNKKFKILVGDYNKESARNTCGTLLKMGFDVDVVETAEDIIERVKSFMHYDLIITNNEYYGEQHHSNIHDSYILLDRLKEIEDFDTPVIVLTVSNDREKFLSYGFNDHIQKLLDENKVMETFKRLFPKMKFEEIKKQ